MRLISILAEARPHITRHVLAAAFVIVSAGVRFYLDDVFQKSFFLTVLFYPAVIASAYFLGLGPALLAVALSAASIRYFFMWPRWQFFDFDNPWDLQRLTLFIFGSSTLAFLVSQLQASRDRISTLASEAIESRDQLRREQELLSRLIDQQDAEKQTLCNDFHDGLIQHVVGAKMLLETRLANLPAEHQIHEIVHHLGKGIADGRRVIRGVRPSVLDEPGLKGPLHELIEHFSTIGFEVGIDCCPDGDDHEVPEVIRTAVFRICQEALTNSWKHSGCTKATVRIKKHDDCLHVEIEDDGCGLAAYPHATNKGFGLKGMEARARLLGGSLEIAGTEKGTRVRARLPFAVKHTA